LTVIAALVGCQRQRPAERQTSDAEPGETSTVPAPVNPPRVVFLGTSITAGLGLDPDQAYPHLIQEKIDSAGLRYEVVNAGVSGETSAGARNRIGWVLTQQPAVLVIETGANDGLRGQSPASIKANIQAIIDSTRRRSPHTRVVLAGMQALPNLGATYGREFVSLYPAIARENNLPLIPFILEGVGGVPRLNQSDGVHPTAEGQRRVAENVWRVLEPVLRHPS
jgi:acyl-CoA thioesterase-1